MITTTAPIRMHVPSPPSVGNPCAHRIMCGPIKLWPNSNNARAVLFSTLADAIVTAFGTHGNPSREANPIIRPYVKPGFVGFISIFSGMLITQGVSHVAMMSLHVPTQIQSGLILRTHVTGVASWLSGRWYPSDGMSSERNYYDTPVVEYYWIRNDAPTSPHA